MTDAASLTEAVAQAAARLRAAGFTEVEARIDASVLARHALDWDLARWLGHQRDPAPAGFGPVFDALLARRAAREPVAYITGVREFFGRPFRVSPAVLIPRPETEGLVERALVAIDAMGPDPRVLDIGTGSGAIAVTLAAERPRARVDATDVSAEALAVARDNATRQGVAARVAFRHGAYLAEATGPWDVIVSNPPYVADGDRATLAPDVAGHEPHLALFSGADGLTCIREIVHLAPTYLASGGWLLFEFGFGQADAVRALIDGTPGLTFVELLPDLQGIPRIAVAQESVPCSMIRP